LPFLLYFFCHCGLDPQSLENKALENQAIAGQARNDKGGGGARSSPQ